VRLHSEEFYAAVVTEYMSGTPLIQTGQKFGIDHSNVRYAIHRAGLKCRPRSTNRAVGVCDHDFFSVIDTEEKAYWLGFFTADGSVSDGQGKSVIQIGLSVVDIDHLEKFRSALHIKNPVHIRSKNNGYEGGNGSAMISVSSPKMVKDLAAYGVVPRKTGKTVAAKIRPDLARHYWRGFVDGDGWLTNSMKDGRPFESVGLCGDYPVMKAFMEWCQEVSGTKAKVHKHYSIWKFDIKGQVAVTIAKELYENSTVFLDRKMESYKKMVSSQQILLHVFNKEAFNSYLEREGMTKYSFCIKNGINRAKMWKICNSSVLCHIKTIRWLSGITGMSEQELIAGGG
jgi:hypothetical protein